MNSTLQIRIDSKDKKGLQRLAKRFSRDLGVQVSMSEAVRKLIKDAAAAKARD